MSSLLVSKLNRLLQILEGSEEGLLLQHRVLTTIRSSRRVEAAIPCDLVVFSCWAKNSGLWVRRPVLLGSSLNHIVRDYCGPDLIIHVLVVHRNVDSPPVHIISNSLVEITVTITI